MHSSYPPHGIQTDLFGESPLPGMTCALDWITEAQERALIGHIDAEPLTPFQFHQWTGKRLTRSYGWTYDFQTGVFSPAEPIPDWLDALKIAAAGFAGLAPHDLVQALIIKYDTGAGIGWHRDRPVFEHVIGVSLGAVTTMRLRRRTRTGFERKTAPLTPRSIYHLTGEARHQWEHSIAAMEQPRWSVTFRSLAEQKAR
jgi:alkylated DNA repair dioxygenase AlkB